MLKNFLLLLVMLMTFGIAFSQEAHRNCGTMTMDAELKLNDPNYLLNRQQIEEFTAKFVSEDAGATRTVITIPVVVHVVYNITAENISDAAINSQIQILNEDFRRMNADAGSTPGYFSGIAADVEIEFCLATIDPSGNPTTGITRTSTTKTSFSTTGNPVKYSTYGHAAWDRNSYLNLWVCDLSSGLLGYAQFPGGSAATDGVVIDYKYFGGSAYATSPYNLGRSGTHEVGHWLNLYHIWGDDGTSCAGTDNVADTPNQANENYGCPSGSLVSCSNGPNGDMYQNYMDYTDDACMNLFTSGQKTRMQALFAPGGSRESLLSSGGCGGGGTPSCSVPSGTSTTAITESSASLNWGSVSGAVAYNARGRKVGDATWTEGSTAGLTISFTGLLAGTDYEWQVQTDCGGGSVSAYTTSIYFTTTGGVGGCVDLGEPNNSISTPYTLSSGTTYNALIASGSDLDYYKFTTTSPNAKIKVTVSSLPADYDVRLYDNKKKQKGISENSGTSNETIIWNTSASGIRYVYVYGYSGAYNATDCYDLKIEVSSSSWRTDGSEIFAQEEWDNAIVNIFPNPASDKISVDYYSVQETGVTMKVYDLLGNLVNTITADVVEGENLIGVDVRNLSAGIYIVEISNGKSNYTDKFIVE
ncbi:MAG: T9SS type A sorting domain-containing protein [Bacteroidetes bacterium]|nr:T9SS type A sorting domain-containing protein [Bacteroidota bacterium]